MLWLQLTMELLFWSYFDDIESDAIPRDYVARNVRPTVESVQSGLERIVSSRMLGQRLRSRLTKVLRDFQAAIPGIRAAERAEAERIEAEIAPSIGRLGPRGARKRLILGLFGLLSEMTTLTKDNKLKHVVCLLQHFGILTEQESDGAFEAVRQAVYRTGAKEELRRASEQIQKRWELLDRAIAFTGDEVEQEI